MTRQPAGPAVQMAVVDYFAGERSEMWLSMAFILLIGVLSAWLFVYSRTGFALALLMTILMFGSVMLAGFALLLIRDHGSSRALIAAMQSEKTASAVASERTRIGVVLSKFKYYRYGAVFLGLLAAVGLMLSDRGWIHGLAAGLLLVVMAQVAIDHFSERRAHTYFEKLTIV